MRHKAPTYPGAFPLSATLIPLRAICPQPPFPEPAASLLVGGRWCPSCVPTDRHSAGRASLSPNLPRSLCEVSSRPVPALVLVFMPPFLRQGGLPLYRIRRAPTRWIPSRRHEPPSPARRGGPYPVCRRSSRRMPSRVSPVLQRAGTAPFPTSPGACPCR